jgi:hypothetical protein
MPPDTELRNRNLLRLHLEPDKSKWCSKHDFEKKWQEISVTVLG